MAVHPCTIMLKRALYSIGKEREEEKRRGTRGTDSWLDDTDKKIAPDLPLLFNLHEIWSVDCPENY